MRYSHEYKLECIELYRKGIWPETPEGIKTSNFHLMVRYWVRIEEQNGPDALKHLGNNKVWTPEAKYDFQKTSKIPYLETTGMPTRILLKKRRFKCYQCSKMMVAETSLVKKNHQIPRIIH